MPNIQVLDPHVADLIAAGEVVERPASVAKELMENAIDAGASSVTVEIAHGGLTFLRVTDDGKGIPADQLRTAFLRHATSKLRTEYDLEAIGTLGFRGEALAAIAAVSRVEVMSRTADAPLGASLALEGGEPGPVEEAGCPLGTTMVVRDLFYNTPARLKFMKKDAAEGAAVFAVVQRTALSHPEVSVKFLRDGKQELLTPGDGQLQSAVYAVLGRELALGFTRVKGSGEEMSVTGFVSKPVCCRASRNWQFFFVNGRQVKSRLMLAALEEAYQNQKMVGRFPACVLHLEVKLSAVDVNVHPAKTEVKFGSERAVFSAVYHAVRAALEGDRTRPSAVLEPIQSVSVPAHPPAPVAEPPRTEASAPLLAVHDSARPVQKRPVRSDPLLRPQALSPQPVRPAPVPPERTVSTPPENRKTTCQAQVGPALSPVEENVDNVDKSVDNVENVRLTATNFVENRPKPHHSVPETVNASPKMPRETAPESLLPQEEPWRLAGEVLNTYIIVEQGDKVLFIDKHAAHERMNFDRMKAEGYDPMSQTLLAPAVCRLSPEEHAALTARLPLLEEFGFAAEDFGGGSLIVRRAPFDVDPGDIEATITEIARKLLSTGSADPTAARDELLHTMACKAAIKGGWRSSPQELERVARALMSGQVRYCPHGRPVAIELTRGQLEKQFRRA